MPEMTDLEQKIKEKLSLSQEREGLRWHQLQQQMAEAEARHQRYTAPAAHGEAQDTLRQCQDLGGAV